jgi:hypothetical protein
MFMDEKERLWLLSTAIRRTTGVLLFIGIERILGDWETSNIQWSEAFTKIPRPSELLGVI